jgi:hypothetical protein
LQHLLEHARHRLTRDFEHWYVHVYLDDHGSLEGEPQEEEVDESELRKAEEVLVPTMPNLGVQAQAQAVKVTTQASRLL